MKIVILGAGGVGGYFGGRLAAGGNDVIFVARGAHLAALRRNGLTIMSPRGNLDIPRIETAETIGEVATADLVLVSVKLSGTEGTAAGLGPIAKRGAAIVEALTPYSSGRQE